MPFVDLDASNNRRTPTGTVARIAPGRSKANGHGSPMVCVSAFIDGFARFSKVQSVLVIVQLQARVR